jgi:hypothetical protein
LGDETPKDISTEALWENKKEVNLEHIFTIGSDDFEEEENYYFAHIRDIALDKHGNLFVLDIKAVRINKYSPKGIFLHSFELERGNGPGQFSNPMKISIDKDDNLYITNQHDRIIVLDKKGKLVKTIRTKLHGSLAVTAVDVEGNIYLTKGLNSDAHRIFKLNPSGELVNSFCNIKDDKLRELLGKVGGWEFLAVDHDNNLYYTAMYPYEIKKFSPGGKLLNCFSRDADFKEPYIKKVMGHKLTVLASSSFGLAVFPDGKILNCIQHRKELKNNKTENEYWFDVFSQDGKWLISFSNERLKVKYIGFFAIDPFGCLYLNAYNPYPHIKKFKIEFVDKK